MTEENGGVDFESGMKVIHAVLPDGTAVKGVYLLRFASWISVKDDRCQSSAIEHDAIRDGTQDKNFFVLHHGV